MQLADKWLHPTRFTGDYPNWAGYTWLDWSKEAGCPHPGDDYNFGYGDEDLGQDAVACANGIVFHASQSTVGYGNIIILKHQLGYNLKRFVKETYGIETDQLYSLYAHLKNILVKTGDDVGAGSIIGNVGKSGTQWAHLHFEIYSLWKDLANVTYRFYPVGWSKEKIAQNWLPAYSFIEATKQIDSFESFLGKSKDYWLQVEKDREGLLKQMGEKDKEFLKILEPLNQKIKDLTNEIQQLKDESSKWDENLKKIDETNKNKVKKLEEIITTKEEDIKNLKIRITELLSEQSKKYQTSELLKMFIEKLFKKGGKNA